MASPVRRNHGSFPAGLVDYREANAVRRVTRCVHDMNADIAEGECVAVTEPAETERRGRGLV